MAYSYRGYGKAWQAAIEQSKINRQEKYYIGYLEAGEYVIALVPDDPSDHYFISGKECDSAGNCLHQY